MGLRFIGFTVARGISERILRSLIRLRSAGCAVQAVGNLEAGRAWFWVRPHGMGVTQSCPPQREPFNALVCVDPAHSQAVQDNAVASSCCSVDLNEALAKP